MFRRKSLDSTTPEALDAQAWGPPSHPGPAAPAASTHVKQGYSPDRRLTFIEVLTEPLVSASGADRSILHRTWSDRPKFVGLGGALVVTATLAALSALFALTSALRAPLTFAIPLAIGWGLAIFTLDRWIVAATERVSGTWRNVGAALPRLALALVLGAVVSEPIVLHVFKPEIDAELTVMQREEADAFTQALASDARTVTLNTQRTELNDIQSRLASGPSADAATTDPTVVDLSGRLKDAQDRLSAAQAQVSCEGTGSCGSGVAGAGRIFDANVAAVNTAQAEVNSLTTQLTAAQQAANVAAQATFEASKPDLTTRAQTLSQQVAEGQASLDATRAAQEAAVAADTGLLARIEALERITNANPALLPVRVVLFLFFLLLELLPTLLKLMTNLAPRSTYEHLRDASRASTVRRVNKAGVAEVARERLASAGVELTPAAAIPAVPAAAAVVPLQSQQTQPPAAERSWTDFMGAAGPMQSRSAGREPAARMGSGAQTSQPETDLQVSNPTLVLSTDRQHR